MDMVFWYVPCPIARKTLLLSRYCIKQFNLHRRRNLGGGGGGGGRAPFILQPSIVTTQISKHLPGPIMSKCASIAAKSILLNFFTEKLVIAASIVQKNGRGRKSFTHASRAVGYSAPPTFNIFLRL